MILLALDSATESCSVAVLEDENLLTELTDISGQTHSKHLMVLVETALRMTNLSIQDMDVLAVTRGPGSFTGLRIGLSAAKGLAAATRKQIIPVSCLEALAWQSGFSDRLIYSVIDARRNEVYAAGYRWSDDVLIKEQPEHVCDVAEAIQAIREPCDFIGNGAVKYQQEITALLGSSAHFAPGFNNMVRAATVGFLGFRQWKKDKRVTRLEELSPQYLRKSDAQLNQNIKVSSIKEKHDR
ncbi:MAG: tRNA (adenosine(37)-N6)-threonylcarbamoyltransferase complex dimerization subunit type 1 TsaB [Desulfobacteraceae bacterium]|nr:tRNA (adenosine(37)-N6)-threonylcarbamoyltransferase complex dimerization subunit type 1 TsaB [Desulfobacteraceae bacterium]